MIHSLPSQAHTLCTPRCNIKTEPAAAYAPVKTSHNACSSVKLSPADVLARYEHPLAESRPLAVVGGALIPAWWVVLHWEDFPKAPTALSCPQIPFCAKILDIFKFYNTHAKNIVQVSGTLCSCHIVILCWYSSNTWEAACRFCQAKLKKALQNNSATSMTHVTTDNWTVSVCAILTLNLCA